MKNSTVCHWNFESLDSRPGPKVHESWLDLFTLFYFSTFICGTAWNSLHTFIVLILGYSEFISTLITWWNRVRKKLWPFQNGMFSITEIGKNWKNETVSTEKNTLWHKSIGTACKLALGYQLSSRYRISVESRDFHGRSQPQSSVENTLLT